MTDRNKGAKSERDESTEESAQDYKGDSTTSTGPEDIAAQVGSDKHESPTEQGERERRERGFGVGNRSQ